MVVDDFTFRPDMPARELVSSSVKPSLSHSRLESPLINRNGRTASQLFACGFSFLLADLKKKYPPVIKTTIAIKAIITLRLNILPIRFDKGVFFSSVFPFNDCGFGMTRYSSTIAKTSMGRSAFLKWYMPAETIFISG